MINKLTGELEKTNQRLDEIKIVSIENIEQKLTKQVKKKEFFFIYFFGFFYCII
jgi:hypothetical protein